MREPWRRRQHREDQVGVREDVGEAEAALAQQALGVDRKPANFFPQQASWLATLANSGDDTLLAAMAMTGCGASTATT